MKNNVCASDKHHECTGCGVCSAVCPCEAIKITEGNYGFYRPVIDESKCIDCSLCKKVCYKFDSKYTPLADETYECYAAANKSDAELSSSSSGAVSIELMRECLKLGYYVVGVAYDNELERAITKIAKVESELEQFKGSKYFQSYTADAFRAVVSDKSEQKYAVFGTPCQIYAFAKIAEVQKNRDKYIFVDIFCHGCPSLKLWDKYLEFVKAENKVNKFDRINFRSKSHGWHEYAFDFIKGTKKVTSSKYNDPFHELFFGLDTMNEACFDCVARSTVEKTDIRIGDFWGKRYNSDTKGVSAVVIASERGRELFSMVTSKFNIDKADFSEIISAQSYKKTHHCSSSRREKLFALLCVDDDIKAVVKKRRKLLSAKTNLKRELKSILKHLPAPVYLKLKNKLGQ